MQTRSPSAASRSTAAASFSTGDRLAGQRRLVDVQLALAHEAQVGRHLVAGLQQHEVAGDDLGRRQAQRLARAHHRRLGRHRLRQRLDGGDRLGLLDVADERVEEHDAEDHGGVDPVPENERDDAGGDEDEDQRLLELQRAGAPGRRVPCAA